MAMDAATAGLLSDPGSVPDKYSSLANFREEKWIGKGQFSVVYRARCLADNSIVALKKVKVPPYPYIIVINATRWVAI